MYMYHTHTMEEVHGINLSTCSDLPLMNIMIISQIDLQWTQFNSISIFVNNSKTCTLSNFNA